MTTKPPHKRKRWLPKKALRYFSDEDLDAILDEFEIDYGTGTETSEFMVTAYGDGMGRGVDVDLYEDLSSTSVPEDEGQPSSVTIRHRWAHVKLLELFPRVRRGRVTVRRPGAWSDYTLYEWLVLEPEDRQAEVIDAARAYIDESGEHAYEEWMTRKDFEEIRSQW